MDMQTHTGRVMGMRMIRVTADLDLYRTWICGVHAFLDQIMFIKLKCGSGLADQDEPGAGSQGVLTQAATVSKPGDRHPGFWTTNLAVSCC